jgi:hypothetical protein
MNKKFFIVLAALVLAPAAFCQEFGEVKDTLAIAVQQDMIVADTLAAKKAAEEATLKAKWQEEANNPQSVQIIQFKTIPMPEKDAVGQYYEQFAGYLQVCDSEKLVNTVKQSNAEYPYFLRIHFTPFYFNIDYHSHQAGTVLEQMIKWVKGCKVSSADILAVYSLNKPFYDTPSQLQTLTLATDDDSFKAATKFFTERSVCEKSCKKEFFKAALLSTSDNPETIKMLLAKTGAPSAEFVAMVIRKRSLGDKDVQALRGLLRANPGLLYTRIEGSASLSNFIVKVRGERSEEHTRTGFFWRLFSRHKKNMQILDDMSKLVREMKFAQDRQK